jgi:hypothetical protein
MPEFGKGIAYRAGVATVAIAMGVALLVLRGVPDNFHLSMSQLTSTSSSGT